MSLVLNDEQEKALREWYHMDSGNSWRPTDQPKGLRLAEAIAPLMKPWRVEPSSHHNTPGWAVTGESFTIAYACIEKDAQLICDLLNESEGKR